MDPEHPSRPGTEPTYTEESALELVAASQELLRRGLEAPGGVILESAMRAAEQAVRIFEEVEHGREPAMAAMGNVAPLLILGGRADVLEERLARMVAREVDCGGAAETYGKGLLNALGAALHFERPREAGGVLDLALRLARLDPPQLYRWETALEVAHQYVRYVGTQHGWADLARVRDALRGIPETFQEATAPARSRTLCTWAILAVDAGEHELTFEAADGLSTLHARHPAPAVRHELANALSCLVEVLVYRQQRSPAEKDDLISRLFGLAQAHPRDRELARIVAVTAPAIIAHGLAGRDDDHIRAVLGTLVELAGRHPGDEEIAFDIARAIAGNARYRVLAAPRPPGLAGFLRTLVGGAPAQDRVLQAMRDALARLSNLLPDSHYIELERKNFQKETGLDVDPPEPPPA